MSGGTLSGSGTGTGTETGDDAEAQQEEAANQEQADTEQQSTRRTRTASSSTKVDFTSDVDAVVPTIESLSQNQSFPWGWVFGGLGALGIAAYFIAKSLNRKQR